MNFLRNGDDSENYDLVIAELDEFYKELSSIHQYGIVDELLKLGNLLLGTY